MMSQKEEDLFSSFINGLREWGNEYYNAQEREKQALVKKYTSKIEEYKKELE